MRKRTIEEFILKANKQHNTFYDYSKSIYIGKENKIEIICPIHGGFWQLPNNHLRKAKCPQCARIDSKETIKEKELKFFLEKAKEKHNNKYSYEKLIYKTQHDKVEITCPNHGSFWQLPYSHLKSGCPICFGENRGYIKFTKAKEKFIEEANKIHNNKYDYSKFVYSHSRSNSIVICPKHGDFLCSPNNHLRGRICPVCSYELRGDSCRSNTQDFIEKANSIHNNKYNYSKTVYTTVKDIVEIICPTHGNFLQVAGRHIYNFNGCPKCTHNKDTKPEKIIQELLTKYNIEFLPNDRDKLEGKEIDVFIPSKNIGIEINGVYWHSELYKEPNYHLKKLELAESKNIKLIQIWDIELDNSLIINKIKHILGINDSEKIFARNCKIENISSKESNIFLKNNHIQGKDNAKIRYGLKFAGELVAVMTFSKPRFNKVFEWELVRYSTSKNIIGGASKLLSHFEKTLKPKNLLSYADRRFTNFTNNVYTKIGFKYEGSSKPNYFYINNGKDVITRYCAQKHKLNKFLENYDENLTEVENMNNNDYYRVFDCGNLIFSKNYEVK